MIPVNFRCHAILPEQECPISPLAFRLVLVFSVLMSASLTLRNMQQACGGIRETRELLSSGHTSVTDHIQSVLTAIHENNPWLSAFVSVAGDNVLKEAEEADRRIAELGPDAWRDKPLLGIVVSVKDLIQTEDLPTTRGSLVPNDRVRADAPAVARLRAAGAIVIGKTTTSEYGWCGSTVSRVAPPTRNPRDPDRSAGGSSGGAAAAVAAGLCTVALGTDGGGSVRIPAAFCGVVGFKPSFGRVPYVPPGAERLAHLGPLTRSVPDAIEVFSLLARPDAGDPDSGIGALDPPRGRTQLRIGWVEFPRSSPEVTAAVGRVRPTLTGLGYQVEQIDVPFPDPYEAFADIAAAAEATATRPEDEELCDQGRLAIVRYGRTLRAVSVMRAEEVRLALRRTLWWVMDRYDLLAMPTVGIEPFAFDAIAPSWAADPASLLWAAWTPATYPFNMTGQPAISLPVGLAASGLPVGLQLIGPFGGDNLVLSTARDIEAALGTIPPTPGKAAKEQ